MPENITGGGRGQAPPPAGAPTAALLGAAYQVLGMVIVEGVNRAGFPQRPAHSAVFANIDLGGTRLSDLAARANMTPQAMGELVDDLESLGYVRRRPHPDDRRAKLVVLTPKGRRCVEAGIRVVEGIEERLRDQLGGRRLADLRRAAGHIIGAWAPPPAAP
ncbi:MAG: MarR family winged helix-turn-helix transcriptional regulator [Actinobacteria bacterium]|nr:MarR family winged helix-turn-helix transcriptional regulator [Actinomycetota bacterium]